MMLTPTLVLGVDNAIYHRCASDIDVIMANNSIKITAPNNVIELQCGQTITRNYDIEFFETFTTTCNSELAMINFTKNFQEYTDNFDAFIKSSNRTKTYYNEYLTSSVDLASCNQKLTSYINDSNYKKSNDECQSSLLIAQRDRDSYISQVRTEQTDTKTLTEEVDSLKQQRILIAIAGLVIGALGWNTYAKKGRKTPQSDAQAQLPHQR